MGTNDLRDKKRNAGNGRGVEVWMVGGGAQCFYQTLKNINSGKALIY
jgi:hypothetical protein